MGVALDEARHPTMTRQEAAYGCLLLAVAVVIGGVAGLSQLIDERWGRSIVVAAATTVTVAITTFCITQIVRHRNP